MFYIFLNRARAKRIFYFFPKIVHIMIYGMCPGEDIIYFCLKTLDTITRFLVPLSYSHTQKSKKKKKKIIEARLVTNLFLLVLSSVDEGAIFISVKDKAHEKWEINNCCNIHHHSDNLYFSLHPVKMQAITRPWVNYVDKRDERKAD